MTTAELADIRHEMSDGLQRVQAEVRPSDAAVVLGLNSNLDLGIVELDNVRQLLGAGIGIPAASTICVLSQNPNVAEWFAHPKQLLVDNPLHVIATCEGLPMDQRLILIDEWIRAVSSGVGHYYLFKWAARFSVAASVQSVSMQAFSLGRDWAGKPISAAESLVDTFDFNLPVIGKLLKRLRSMERNYE